MAASNAPDPSYGETPPNQYIPISSTDKINRPPRRPGGCVIAAVIAFIAFCAIGGIIG